MNQHALAATPLHCIIDRIPIPRERAVKRSNTCSKECAQLLRKIRRAQDDERECRHCARPSTPEERKAFKAWRATQPGYAKKRGRPVKQKAATA